MSSKPEEKTTTFVILTLIYLLNPAKAFEFIQNKGQWHQDVKFRTTLNGIDIFVEKNGLTLLFYDLRDIYLWKQGKKKWEDIVLRYHAVKLTLSESDLTEATGLQPASHYYNFFIGNDPHRWATQVKAYKSVILRDQRHALTLLLRGEGENSLKIDYVLNKSAISRHAHKTHHKLELSIEGADSVKIHTNRLIIYTSLGNIEWYVPAAYQLTYSGDTLPVRVSLQLDRNKKVRMTLSTTASTNILVIDPVLVASTYTGSTADNWGFTATYDQQGYIYVGGIAFDNGYPTTPGAFQVSFQGGSPFDMCTGAGWGTFDIALTKFSPDGSTIIWSTYLGGTTGNERPHSLIVNSAGDLLVYGTTCSSDFPTTSTAFDNTFNGGADVIVVRLSSSGTTLVGSTFLGGTGRDGINIGVTAFSSLYYNYGDDARGEIVVDDSDYVYIASCSNSPNFPVSPTAVQTTLRGGQDAILAKLSPDLSTLVWSTYLGGTANDAAYGIRVTRNRMVYVCGGTASADFPVTAGSFQPFFSGIIDGFVTLLDSSGTNLIASSLIGTPSYDQIYFLDRDFQGKVYLLGQTEGNYPVSAGVYFNIAGKQFIQTLDSTLSTSQWSTVFGSGSAYPDISPTAFMVDRCGNIYISGWGTTCLHSLYGMPNRGNPAALPTTPNAIQPASADGCDFYLMVLGRNAATLRYATFFGAPPPAVSDHVDGGTSRFDPNGIVYEAVCAGCGGFSTFPTTAWAYSRTNNSQNCNLAVFRLNFELIYPSAVAEGAPSDTGCVPFTISFQNTSTNASHFWWDFGDGSPPSSDSSPSHTYSSPGVYTVTLIAYDSIYCFTSDTTLLTIVVRDTGTRGYRAYPLRGCVPLVVVMEDTSNREDLIFIWQFSDSVQLTGKQVSRTFDSASIYSVAHIIIDTVCGRIDTFRFQVEVLPAPIAHFTYMPDSSITIGQAITFLPQDTTATVYRWTFGDGQSSSAMIAVHTYTRPGTYTVCLYTENQYGCRDSACRQIDIHFHGYADVPSAFTPNGDGVNDILYVYGYGMEKIDLKIYNRWGELIFHTTDPTKGWDGTYRGVPQEMDAYAYTLWVKFIDGTTLTKSGSITLIR